MRKEKGVRYELVFALGAETLTSREPVISTTAAKSRVLSWRCFSTVLASGPKGWARSFPFGRFSQSPTRLTSRWSSMAVG